MAGYNNRDLYLNSLRRSPAGLEGPMDSLSAGAMTPEIDFSKSSFSEQAPQAQTVGGQDITGQTPSGIDYKGAGVKGAETLAKGGSGTDAAASALMATGHPAGIAAGLGLMTMSTIEKKKQANRETKYKQEVAKAEARRDAINRLSQIGQGLKA
jgi:hypothetical protein